MQHLKLKESPNNDILESINVYTIAMADTIKSLLPVVNLEKYFRFLDIMYHYTLKSGERLHRASLTVQEKNLKEMFKELSREEAYHYRLAEQDLKKFGKAPSASPPHEVEQFHAFWEGITSQQSNKYLGAVYVLENVGTLLIPEVKQALGKLQLQPNQARFIMVHLEADIDHARRLEEACLAYGHNHIEDLLEGAKKASQFWIDIHQSALL
jgi:hypothetical protein